MCVWLIFFLFLKILFIYLLVCWVFFAAQMPPPVAGSGSYSSKCGARDSHCSGSLFLQSTGSKCMDFSSCGSQALDCLLSSCGSVVVVCGLSFPTACEIFSDQGLNPCPCIGGRFFTTELPEKPSGHFSCYLKYPSFSSSAD